MAFQLSPGVNVTERDLTTIVPAVATTNAGMVGVFDWGPVNQRVLVDSENNLVKLYGTPNDDNYEWWFTAANFLGYGNNLQVVRAGVTGMVNANPAEYRGTETAASGVTSYLPDASSFVENETEIEEAMADKVGPFFARYPGAKGNSIEVQICGSRSLSGVANISAGYTAAGTSWESWAYRNEFDLRPGTSTFVSGKGGSNDEFHAVVIDRDGLFSGERGSVLERFQAVSLVPGTIGFDGQSNYYADKINRTSRFIAASTTVDFGKEFLKGGTGPWGSLAGQKWYPTQNGETGFTASTPGLTANNVSFGVGVYRFKAGNNGDLRWSSDINTRGKEINYRRIVLGQDADEDAEGYYLFEDAETVDVNLLLGGPDYDIPSTGNVGRSENIGLFVGQALKDIVDKRKDCVAFISCPIKNSAFGTDSQKLDQCLKYRDQIGSSSYVFIDSGYKLMYDIYNDKNRWVPTNGDIAGLCARADINFDPWYSPAGFNRGQIRGVIKLAFQPRQSARDNLYKNNVNPVCTFSGEGTVLYGDKTAQTKPSAFDRINVRRLFIVLEKAIATASKYSLFEFNDAFTRSQFRSLVEPFLRDVQSRRGLIDFKVVCDERNNTPEVIDGNRFVADIYIKPNRSINFIQLNFIATRTGVNFSEVGG
jgi:hypothetical protein